MHTARQFSLLLFSLLFSFLLISCGGGGGGGVTPDTSGGTLGGTPTPTPPPDPVYAVTLALLNNSGAVDPATVVSRDEPGMLRATVVRDGAVVPFELVTFTTVEVGVLDPSTGTVRTLL